MPRTVQWTQYQPPQRRSFVVWRKPDGCAEFQPRAKRLHQRLPLRFCRVPLHGGRHQLFGQRQAQLPAQ